MFERWRFAKNGKREKFAKQTTKKSWAFVKLKQRYSRFSIKPILSKFLFSLTLPYHSLPEFSRYLKTCGGRGRAEVAPPHTPVATPLSVPTPTVSIERSPSSASSVSSKYVFFLQVYRTLLSLLPKLKTYCGKSKYIHEVQGLQHSERNVLFLLRFARSPFIQINVVSCVGSVEIKIEIRKVGKLPINRKWSLRGHSR